MHKRGFFLLLIVLIVSVHIVGQDNSQVAIDSIKSIVESQEEGEKVSSLNELAWYYKNIDADSSLYFAKYSYSIAKLTQDDKVISRAFNSLASAHEALGRLDSAEYFHKQGLEIKLAVKDSIGLAQTYNNLGIVYDQMGEFDRSLTEYFSSLKYYEQLDDHEFDVAMVLGNIGIVYKKQKSYDKVHEYYKKALDIYVEIGSEFGQAVTKGNIGSLLINMGEYEQAIAYSEEALLEYKELGYLRYIPYVQCNLGITYDSLENYKLSESYYMESIGGHEEHSNIYELAAAYNALSNSYNRRSLHNKALKAAQNGLSNANSVSSSDLAMNAKRLMSLAYFGLGDYRNAYSYNTLYQNDKDSLFNITRTKTIEELQTKYETTEKEKQLIIQNKQLSEQESTIVMNQVIMVCLLLVLISIAAIAILARSRLHKKQELELQQRELDYRAEQLNAVIDSQEKERKRFATDLHDGFGQLISVLKMNVSAIHQDKHSLEKRAEIFDKSTEILNGMHDELRGICFNLMPHTLVQQGLVEALKEFASRINLAGRLKVEVLVFDFSDRMDELNEVSLYRIIQEWINNILKYGDASSITVQLTKDLNELTLTIEDNGTGFDENLLLKGQGNGWKNINSRANLIKAEIHIDTNAGMNGSTFILNLPMMPKLSPKAEMTV